MGITILFGTFLLCLVIGVPVAICLGVSSAAYLVFYADIPLVVFSQKIFSGVDSFVLLCIPGFIMAGNLMNGGGITDRIIRFASAGVGWIRGGLGLTNIAGSMLFAGISGTAVAEAASIGAVMIPGMKKEGYPVSFAAAITAAASTVGPIIPPSVPMIIVGALSGVSVGRMFMAGAIPGILLGLGMMIVCYIISVRKNYPRQAWKGWKELWHAFQGAFWALMLTALIIGGLLSGVVTPTETAILACVYAFVIGVYIYQGITLRDVPKIMIDSAITSAALLALIGIANVFGWIMANEEIPQTIAKTMLSFSTNKYVIILLINILLLIVGMFMETIAALIILFPPLLAVAVGVGIDPIHFATFAVLNLMIGLTTPPLGICLFVCANIAKTPLSSVIKEIPPFLAGNIFVLLLVAFIPQLSLWLPNLLFGAR
ncbi:MAG: TRAP transporter large permease [Giesbergeria sp.]|nr:TRAP transporter large permease [Giesbergeria sp.]